MDLTRCIREFVNLGGGLVKRLQSSEGPAVSDVDLHILKVQLHLLDVETTKMQLQRGLQAKQQVSGI